MIEGYIANFLMSRLRMSPELASRLATIFVQYFGLRQMTKAEEKTWMDRAGPNHLEN